MDRDSRRAARLRAYRLMESLQGPDHEQALSELVVLEAAVADSDWREVGFLARLGQAMDGVLGRGDVARARRELDALVAYGEELEPAALLAHALGLRAVLHAAAGETELVLADGARGLAALELPDQPALESCTALVVLAAAYNALSLWELVDGLYDRATALQAACEEPLQAPALAMNRVVIRLEWGTSLLEQGDVAGAREVLARAAAAAEVAERMRELPELWRTGAAAARAVLGLYLDPPADPHPLLAQITAGLTALRAGEDQEMLPLVQTLGAYALVRLGRPAEALSWLDAGTHDSSSSGARSFRWWVRAAALDAGELPSAAAEAHHEYAAVLLAQRQASRRAVLAAARSRIAGERTTAERDRLAIDVAVDPLTGLANRRAFDGWLGRERSEPRLTAVLLVDLDDFKIVNDRYGHAVGDDVLRRVGELLARHVRPGDLAIRVGGDEFALILEASNQPDEPAFAAIATARAARLRDAVTQAEWPDLGGDRFGASVGVAVRTLPAYDREAAAELYRTADLALYAEKAARRGATAS